MSVHDLQAPKEDGAVLAYPPLAHVGSLLDENRQRSAALKGDILGKPFQALRSLARRNVLDVARQYLIAAGEPVPPLTGDTILLAGHQPELYHPGVWIKNFALSGLAHSHNATPLNLIVDNDTAKTTVLSVPAGEYVAHVPFDLWQSDVPFEERHVMDEGLFHDLPKAAAPILENWNFPPLLEEFWTVLGRQGERTPLLGERFAAARRTFERRWHCSNLEVPLSLVCQTEAFGWFTGHLLQNLPRFQEIYNRRVRAYRQRFGIRSRHHPVPDLVRDGDWLEAPLWAWRAGGQRRERMSARQAGPSLSLRAGVETFLTLDLRRGPEAWMEQWQAVQHTGWKIRTRALTTTLFTRLFVGDLFIHGLGGGKYDELTDEIMRDFYGIDAPAFLILTGTLLLPLPREPHVEDDQRRLRALERDLWWNPQRHLTGGLVEARDLSAEKLRWIDRPAGTPHERRARFEALRKCTSELRPFIRDETQHVHRNLEQVRRAVRIERASGRRDYAFCLYPESLLKPWLAKALRARY